MIVELGESQLSKTEKAYKSEMKFKLLNMKCNEYFNKIIMYSDKDKTSCNVKFWIDYGNSGKVIYRNQSFEKKSFIEKN